jgi:hypothetical protein
LQLLPELKWFKGLPEEHWYLKSLSFVIPLLSSFAWTPPDQPPLHPRSPGEQLMMACVDTS